MANTTFVPFATNIVSSWLQTINNAVYSALGLTDAGPFTPAQVLNNLGAAKAGANSDITSLANTGAISATSINGGPLAGFKNRLINSLGLINQRGVFGTVTLAASAYGHDRFRAGTGGCTYTFATVNNITIFTIIAGTLQQIIEGINLESATYFLSWAGTAQGRINSGTYGATGTVNSVISGGTNTTVEWNTGTLSLPQFERDKITSFEYTRPIQTELAMCQRYYEVLNYASGIPMATLQAVAATGAYGVGTNFKVTKRIAPVASYTGTINCWAATGTLAGGSPVVASTTIDLFTWANTGASGLVAGNASSLVAATAVTVAFNAEL